MIIAINTQSPTTICDQLREQIILGIAANKLVPNEPLPSVRSLAADLGINYHTVNKAYSALCDDGYIAMDRRKGAVVAQAAAGGEGFMARITRTLSLASAESICRGLSEDEFVRLCSGCYRESKGGAL
jgi:DNA-binding transcriptional regulator YhcF (GntR family)